VQIVDPDFRIPFGTQLFDASLRTWPVGPARDFLEFSDARCWFYSDLLSVPDDLADFEAIEILVQSEDRAFSWRRPLPPFKRIPSWIPKPARSAGAPVRYALVL
jgi:hypothetical protein